ncbi:Uncharacterized protein FWK35_00021845, partial [Aphis craccivora]
MIKDIKQFERLNNLSVNVYSIKRGEITYKNNVKKLSKKKNNQKSLNQYTIFPIKVCTNELEDHHDLLLFGDGSEQRLKFHKINCNKNEPLLPVLPSPE